MRTAVAVLLLCGAAASSARAQVLRLTPGAGELGTETRGVHSAVAAQDASWESFLSTWVNVPVTGALISPRFLSYSAAVRPTRVQQTMRSGDGRFELHTLGLSGSANLLAAAPVSLSVHTDRTTAESPRQAAGTITSYRNGTSGGLLRLRLPAFPMRVEWNARDQADEWRAAPAQAPIRRDESLEVWRVAGESSKLATLFERQRFVDRVGTLDFTSSAATALHAFRWGIGSSLLTGLEAHRREGREAQVRRLFSEHLHLRHSPIVATDLSFHRQRSATDGGYSADVSTTTLAVQAEPRAGLSTSFTASHAATALSNGHLRMTAVTPGLVVRRALPRNVRLVGIVGASYQRTEQAIDGARTTPVADEAHTIDETRQFTLGNERVTDGSVVVYSADRTTLYLEGTDYRLLTLGDLVRIEIPLVSRILVGDRLVVSYVFTSADARAHDLSGVSATASLARGALSFSQSASLRRSRVLSGDPAAGLEGGDDFVSSLDFRRAVGAGALGFSAQQRVRRNARNDFTASELRATFAPRPARTLQSQVGASFSQSSAGVQSATVTGAHATASWQARPGVHLLANAESQRWRLQDGAIDHTTVMSVDLNWRAGRLETEWRYLWQVRSTMEQRVQHRLFARILRRF